MTDQDSRFLRDRRDCTLGYTATVGVSEDDLIVEQRVTQAPTDNAALVPTVEAVEQRCGERPPQVSADSGFFRRQDRKSTRLNSSHVRISYAVFCLKKKKKKGWSLA